MKWIALLAGGKICSAIHRSGDAKIADMKCQDCKKCSAYFGFATNAMHFLMFRKALQSKIGNGNAQNADTLTEQHPAILCRCNPSR